MNNILIAILAGLVGMIGWGTADFFAKKTIDKIGSLKTLIGSQIIGSIILMVVFIIGRYSVPAITIALAFYLFLFAFSDAVIYLLLYRAFEKGVVSIISPIVASAAGFAALVSFFLFKETLTSLGIIGVILIFTGILITSTDFRQFRKSLSKKNMSKGLPEALICMIGWGFWYPFWDRFVKGDDWLFWLTLLRIAMGVLLVLYFFSKIPKGHLFKGYKSVLSVLPMVAIFDTFAYLGLSWGYATTTNVTSLITVLANAFSLPTLVLAYIFLNERISKTQLIGVGSILAGIIASSLQ